MNIDNRMMNKLVKLGLLLMIGGSISACSGDQKWKEEVQLSNGQIIVVEQEMLTELGGDEWALSRSGTKPKERRIQFEFPVGSGNMIMWNSKKK